MTSDHNKVKIGGHIEKTENNMWIQEMERRAEMDREKAVSEAIDEKEKAVTYAYTTFESEGHLVPSIEDVYTVNEKTGELKYSIDKFETWARNASEEHFIGLDEGQTQYIYRDGYYVKGVEGWMKTTMNLCNHNMGVTIHHVKETLHRLGANGIVDRDLIDTELSVMTVLNNCVLNTSTMGITDHTPDYITFSKLACDYIEGAECPEWLEFLDYSLSANEIETLQELFGYCVLRGYPYQVAFFLLGSGGNGKGVAMKVLRAMLGRGRTSAVPMQDVGERFYTSDLPGSYANISGDTSAKALLDSSMYKMLTGEDPIRTEKKNKDSFDFYNHAKIISQMNELMPTKDQTDGFFRRFVLIRFDRTPTPERMLKKRGFDKRIVDNEIPGVLNWALEGLCRLHKRGGFAFTLNHTVEELRKMWNIEADHVLGFVRACCELGGKRVIATEVFMTAYTRWHVDMYGMVPAEDQGDITKARPWTGFQKPSSRRIKNKDIGIWFTDDGEEKEMVNCYPGICLKNTSGHLDVDMNYIYEHWGEIIGSSPKGLNSSNVNKSDDSMIPDTSLHTPNIGNQDDGTGSEIMAIIQERVKAYGGKETDHVFSVIGAMLEDKGYDLIIIESCIKRYHEGHRIHVPYIKDGE